MFLNDLAPVPPFATWIKVSIGVTLNDGGIIDKDIIHMSMPPTLEAMSYQTMHAYGNHIRAASVKEHLTISDYGIMATFEEEYILGPNDQIPILAKLEYVGWVKEILELNYGVLNTIILLCNWVKANYTRSSATFKYGFTRELFIPYSHFRLIICFPPTCKVSFFI